MNQYKTKIYEDGSQGNYMCICCICNTIFFGHKRDILCGESHEEDECKHCRGTGYIENSLWLDDRDSLADVCFVCGGEG